MLTPKALLDSFAEQSAKLFNRESLLSRTELENQFKSMLASLFDKLDLVSRETFDQQMTVLAHTRARLEALETRVAELEKAAAEAKPARKTTEQTIPLPTDFAKTGKGSGMNRPDCTEASAAIPKAVKPFG